MKHRKHQYIGIDPSQVKATAGTSGAIVVLSDIDDPVCIRLNQTRHDVVRQFAEVVYAPSVAACLLEKVSAQPRDGRSSAFKFGEGFGFLQGMLVSLGIPFEFITPASWMGTMVGRRGSSTSKTAWKNYLKGRAQQLYPSENIVLASADAYLLAHYAMKYRANAISQTG